MKRRIISIDRERCNGCGACVDACHEGAIAMVEGKAMLVREDYCDGLGDCLPACPVGAIAFEEREVPANRSEATRRAGHVCSGMRACSIPQDPNREQHSAAAVSRLMQWPCQMKLIPIHAPYFDGADLLVAADCTAYAYGDFHEAFMRGRITLIGCPKLDAEDYTARLAQILLENEINSLTVLRMEVPCCGGLEQAARRALLQCGKDIPFRTVTVTTDGKILQ